MKPSLLRNTLFLLFVLSLLVSFSAKATHLRAGEITVRRDACNSLKFWITITVFTNTINTNVLFGGDDDILDFGDGSDPDGDGTPGILVPETENTIRQDLGNGIATASFTIDHTYSAASTYIISYSEPNRNEGVVNMDQSVNTRFYIETEISIDPFLGCNPNTPVLAVPPIDRGCTGVAWFHNPGAYDLDGDSLSYRLVIPNRERDVTVSNYRQPNAPGFYTDFGTGSENGTPPTFNINPVDGTITWDAPGMAGEYNIAFEIIEWRKIVGEWVRMGFVRRDMQIIIEECENNRPDLIVPEDVCVVAGTTLDATILGIDEDGDDVKIEAFSQIFGLSAAQSPATFSPEPAFRPSPSELQFQWNTECAHVQDQPYQVVFKVTDDGGPENKGPRLVTFKTWLIRVVGPPPEWVDAQPDLTDRSVDLTWDQYFCDNASVMQVWRRVDSLAFEPDSCQTGMPDNLGFELVEEVALTDGSGNPVTTYTDTNGGQGLASGAVYCYRLVALFPAPRGGESYVSDEICIPPILADEPVITNVTVDRTGKTDGQITVRWVKPFEANQVQFPPPYAYKVYRAEGFTGKTNLTLVPTADPSALVITDTGLDTEDKVYNYRIFATASNSNPLDTSAVASSVRLEAQSQLNKIQLTWSAEVPWSIASEGLKHRIYRSDNNAVIPTQPDQLQLLAEIDVLSSGFTFTDGEDATLEPKLYCYVVETLGTYGNDEPILKDKEPFLNFSQIICAEPGDEEPPCPPIDVVAHEPEDCEKYITEVFNCNNANAINNTIKWTRPDESECGNDVSHFVVYFAAAADGVFVPLEDQFGNVIEVKDTFFVHSNLPSNAGCYKIGAVDRSGNPSELTDAVCFDNCPYYELPNVFSPNGDNCNDLFSAYSDRNLPGENEGGICPNTLPENSRVRCARFVRAVEFKVYNRWGKQVYTYESEPGGEKTIYIDWDGRSTDGVPLAAGVYFYVARVTFDTSDPAKRTQIFKDWVHLIRGDSN
jgi:hypothetical protein